MRKNLLCVLCFVLIVPSYNARLCERMTPCDLFRFIRTHKKQISSVDEKTVRVDFLTLNLYNEGVDLRHKVDDLEHSLKQVTLKRSSLMDVAADEDQFERVDHHGANQHLHQLIMVLRKWLADVRGTVNATLREAVAQQEEMEWLQGGVREGLVRAASLRRSAHAARGGAWRDRAANGTHFEAPLNAHCLFCNGDSKRRYSMLDADKGIRLASNEMKNIKLSLANIKQLVNQTEQHCFHKLSKLASRIEYLTVRLKTLEST